MQNWLARRKKGRERERKRGRKGDREKKKAHGQDDVGERTKVGMRDILYIFHIH